MIHPVIFNPIINPLMRILAPVQWEAGKAGHPDGAIIHWDADIDPYSEQVGGVHTFNHAVLAPQYQLNADGSYIDVGAKPAVDVFGGEKWLRSCGAVTNMLTNSVFAGAVSGTPGTAPTGWSLAFNTGQLLVANQRLTFSANVGRNVLSQNISLLANTTYVFSVLAEMDGEQDNGSVLLVSGAPVGTTLSYMIDNSTSTQSEKPIAGLHVISVAVVVGATEGVATFRLGIGCASNRIGTATISNPQLTATAYPAPYVPTTTAGPVTQPASNATTTNGSWFALPDGSQVWRALDGQIDGVEKWDAASALISAGWTYLGGGVFSCNNVNGDFYIDSILIAGDRCKHVIEILTRTSGGVYSLAGGTISSLQSSVGVYSNVLIVGSGTRTGCRALNFVGTVRIHSIQRIQPQPLTLATRVRMGVRSGDIATAATDALVVSVSGTDAGRFTHMFRGGVGEANVRIMQAADGTAFPFLAGVPWQRNAIIRRVTQVNTAGTQFRVGYMIEGTHTEIQWGSWGNYDGSMNPSTLYRLLLGYANTYPLWFNKIAVWKEQVSDARIMEALS